jgi:hypothetical protein
VFVIMNFRASIKQVLARMSVAKKKKDLKVTVNFKKELIPFLGVLRRAGIIYKYTKKKKTFVLCLKKTRLNPLFKQKQKILRDYDISAILYKNPVALVFLSTTGGVYIKTGQKVGGTQLFLTY